MIVSMGGEAKKNSLVIDTMGSQPLSRGPSTYHRCNSYNVSTQLGPEKGGGRKQERAMRTYTRLYSYRRAVRVQRERQPRRHETFAPDRGVPIFLSSSFPNLRYATTYRRCTAKPMYYVFFLFFLPSYEVTAPRRR